jgi:ribokinase
VQLIAGAGAVLLQREVPEAVNVQAAQLAAAAGVPVLLDAGGVESPLSNTLLQHLSTISPNETELQRLTGQQADTEAQVLAAAAALQRDFAGLSQQQRQETGPGAQQAQESPCKQLSVLVKRGSAGSMMVGPAGHQEALQPAIAASKVADTTGETFGVITSERTASLDAPGLGYFDENTITYVPSDEFE